MAFTQYLRVGLVAVTAPLVAGLLPHDDPAAHRQVAGAGADTASGLRLHGPVQLVTAGHQIPGLVGLLAIGVLGIRVGRRLRLPAPALLGPMLLTLLATFTGAAGGFTPTGPLRDRVSRPSG